MQLTVVDALRQHEALQHAAKRRAGTHWQEHGLVFTTVLGVHGPPMSFRWSFFKALTRAGLPHMRFHDLRHSCASLLAAQGANPRVVQRILGHGTIHTTLGIYTHVDSVRMDEALATLDTTLSHAIAVDDTP